MYNYLIVGSGLFGSVFARQAADAGKKVLVIDKRPNIAGNVYTEKVEGINFHKYGAHIFHTNNTEVWNYVNRFATFNRFTNSPVANYKGELYSMPFNMYTFNKMWGVVTPEEAAAKIEEQKKEITGGIGDGLFAPDDQITREQIVTILYRFAKFRGLDVGDTTDLAKKFTDAARVSDYAKEALSWAVAVGIINGMPDNTIAPQNSATRAEVATIIMRYTKLVSGTEN